MALIAAEAVIMTLARGGGSGAVSSHFWVAFAVVNGLFTWILAGLKLSDWIQARWTQQGTTPDDPAVGCFAAFVILSIPLALGVFVAAVVSALS